MRGGVATAAPTSPKSHCDQGKHCSRSQIPDIPPPPPAPRASVSPPENLPSPPTTTVPPSATLRTGGHLGGGEPLPPPGEEAGKLHPGADGAEIRIRIKETTKGLKKISNNDLQPAIKMSRRWYLLSSHCKHFLPNSRPAATGRPLCKWPCGSVRPRGPAVAGRWPPVRRLRVAPRLEPSCPTDTISARGHARLCNHSH